jgi:hypothetical protein
MRQVPGLLLSMVLAALLLALLVVQHQSNQALYAARELLWQQDKTITRLQQVMRTQCGTPREHWTLASTTP